MLHYELPDIEQPGQVLQSWVILDGFNHLGETVTFKLIVCHCLSVIVSNEAGSVCCFRVKRCTIGFLKMRNEFSKGQNKGKPSLVKPTQK